MAYIVGVDIGGTFTDCVVLDQTGKVTTAKSPSTPGNFSQGMIDAITRAAEKLDVEPASFFGQISLLAHGTTVGTNAIVQKRGAKVGLITTRGHNDVLHIMRGSRGFSGRDLRKVVHFPEGHKPDPIIPKRLIEGVSERVDCFGEVVVPLNENEAVEAIRRLLAKGVEAIAICFLWSFLYPAHERRVRALVQEMAPHVFVTCSVDLVPKWGEYERATATALNAYIGPLTSSYLHDLKGRLVQLGYRHPVQITQCGGGTISVEKATQAPLLTLDSGPVSGVTGSAYLARMMDCPNVITTDMGGTSFDVGIIHNAKAHYSSTSSVNQYEFFIPKVDIQAIGSGGGSLVTIDEATQSLRVGPESAGAQPGPICYQRGGTIPTVTDAAVVLGYLDPYRFAEGRIRLDKEKAASAIAALGQRLSMSLMECASGIAKIAEFQMADIIRKMTVGKGLDPRDFVLFAFGGAGPVHAGVFARELGVQKVIIPQRETASCWCAFGAASADVLHVHEQVDIMAQPFSADRIDRTLAKLESEARAELSKSNLPSTRQSLRFSLDVRHQSQINEVEVAIDWARTPKDFEPELRKRFYEAYERLYGRGSSFAGTPLEIVTFRVRAEAEMPRPRLRAGQIRSATIPASAHRVSRQVYWEELKQALPTPALDGTTLLPGNRVSGPALIETPDTTVVVRPGQALQVDQWSNFELYMSAGETR